MKPGPNAGYSGIAFVEDREYAKDAAHYTRALLLIIDDLRSIFEFVEPSDEGCTAFSYRIHALLMRTCIEIEANFRAIFDANIFSLPRGRSPTILDFRKIDVSHHLSSYEVTLPMWNGKQPLIQPFAPWRPHRGQVVSAGISLPWYRAYNASKHSRAQAFKEANLWVLVEAVAALLIVVTAQFGSNTFDAGPTRLVLGWGGYHAHQPSIGELFRLKYPDDWEEDELYDFDWSILKGRSDRFEKIDYNAILA